MPPLIGPIIRTAPKAVVQAPTLPPILLARAPAPTRQQTQAAAYRAAPPVYTKPVYVPPAPKVVAPSPPTPATFHDAGPIGDYGTKAADALKQTDAYRQSVVDVFLHQQPHQQQAIVSGALRNTASPEGGMILDYLRNQLVPADAVPHGAGTLTMRMPGVTQPASAYPNVAPSIPAFRAQSPPAQRQIVQDALKNPSLGANKTLLQYVRQQTSGPAGQLLPLTAAIQAPQLGAVSRELGGVPSGVFKILQAGAKDIATMPSGTLQGLWSTGSEAAQAGAAAVQGDWSGALKHEKNLANQVVGPYAQLGSAIVTDPGKALKMVEAHPVNTALMLSGLKSLIGRGIMKGGQAAGRDWASTARAPLHLGTISGEPTPNPLVEYRSYSNDAINKIIQRAREKAIVARGQNPNIARPVPSIPFTETPVLPQALRQAFNVGSEAKLRRVADEMAAVRQTLGRVERGKVLHEVSKGAPAAKEAHNVVTHILQGVIRSPKTAIADIAKEVQRLKDVRTHARSEGGVWNRKQVKDLETAAKTPGALEQAFATAENLRPTMHGQDNMLLAKRVLTPDQVEAKYFPYAQAHMGAIYDHAAGQLIAPTGTIHEGAPLYKPLSTDEIKAHLEANGVPDPAYVGHYQNRGASGEYYKRYSGTRGTLSKGKRTGEEFRKGTYDHTYKSLAGQIAARAEAVTNASLHDRIISNLGVLKPKAVVDKQVRETLAKARQDIRNSPGQQHVITAKARKEVASIKTGMYTPAEAKAAAHASMHEDFGNRIGSELELTPIAASSQKTIDWVKGIQDPNHLQNVSNVETRALIRAIDEAAGRTDGVRNVVLAPTASIERLADQFRPRERSLVGRSVYQFRNTVLPYSSHWMFQIGSEAGIRAALAGALSPHYAIDARRLMNRLMETEKGRAAMAEMTGHGGFYGQRGTMNIYQDPGAALAFARAHQPTRGIIKANNAYGDFVSKAMGGLEHNFRLMGLGKLAHGEVREFGNQWRGAIRLEGQVLEQLATRLEADPALVARFGRQIDHMFGQYSKYSPKLRATIQTYAPFLPWYLTATKYVFWQLPVHHPVASALLASLRQTVNQDIADGKSQPLNAFATQALGTLTPFGIFTPDSSKVKDLAKEFVQKSVSLAVPQAQGPFLALAGDSPFFGRLQGPHGSVAGMSPQAIATAAESAIEAGVPLATKLRQALEGGRPSYGTSTLLSPQPKPDSGPGDLSQILNRTLNPFYSFQRAKNATPSSSGGGSGSFVIPGSGGTNGFVIPGSGGTGGFVIP